jgi:hypothetical protein
VWEGPWGIGEAFFLDITYKKHLETNRALMGERWAGRRREFQWPIMETHRARICLRRGTGVGFYKDLEELRGQLGVTRGSRRWRASCANVYIRNGRRHRSFDRGA